MISVVLTAIAMGPRWSAQAEGSWVSSEAIARVAASITVRIEGAVQGSGVLVKRQGSRYTVLTAWHVVSGQRPGEELDVVTPDGQRHAFEQGSIQRVGQVDLAVLTFSSARDYALARVGEEGSSRRGDRVLVSGFPANDGGRLKVEAGTIVAQAAVGLDQGYQLLYTNATDAGMSGGAVLAGDGTVIGLHGRGELDASRSRGAGMTVKTGINQGVPVAYYRLFAAGIAVRPAATQATTADDFLAQALMILATGIDVMDNSRDPEIIGLLSKSLDREPRSALAYALRVRVRAPTASRAALDDANRALALDPTNWHAFYGRANARDALGDPAGAQADFSQAITLRPGFAFAYNGRGSIKLDLKDYRGAFEDYSRAVEADPGFANAWANRGFVKERLGDRRGACEDTRRAASMGFAAAQQRFVQWGCRWVL